MKELKEKLFMVLGGSLDVLEFEQWLYANAELVEQIDSNPIVFDIYTLNYKDYDVIKLVETICLQFEDPEAQLVATIERTCRKIVKLTEKSEILKIVERLDRLYDWEESFELMSEFYSLNVSHSLAVEGYNKGFNLIYEAKKLAKAVINELQDKSMEEKIEFLMDGFPVGEKPIITVQRPKPWYQFW